MPTTRKQREARKPREIDFLSDIGSMDIMLGGNHLEVMAASSVIH